MESGTHAELLAKPASKYAGQALHDTAVGLSVVQLRILNPVLFSPMDSGSGTEKNPDPRSGIRPSKNYLLGLQQDNRDSTCTVP